MKRFLPISQQTYWGICRIQIPNPKIYTRLKAKCPELKAPKSVTDKNRLWIKVRSSDRHSNIDAMVVSDIHTAQAKASDKNTCFCSIQKRSSLHQYPCFAEI